MAIRFILGTSGSGKTRHCIDAAAGALRSPDGPPLVFLTPEQATFQVERAILSCPGIEGYSRLQVLSFNRLEFWLCQAGCRNELSALGRQMLVRRAIAACADRLSILKASAERPGLAKSVAELIGRLHEDNCDPQMLNLAAGRMIANDSGSLTARKLMDIAAIFDTYLQMLNRPDGEILNPDALLTEARSRVKNASFLKGARLWVDGFSGFTFQQRDLLFEMLSICSCADIALCLDPEQFDLNNTDPNKLDISSLFAPTEQTYLEMLTILRHRKMSPSEPVILNDHPRFQATKALGHIERTFFQDLPGNAISSGGAVQITGLSDCRAEAFYTARTISDLVRQGPYCYRDIAVVIPQMDSYAHHLIMAFEQYRIPYFLDRPKNLAWHPLIELLIAALTAVREGFSAASMLSLLKTELNGLTPRQSDMLDNACRELGVDRPDWLSEDPWICGEGDSIRTETVEAIRKPFFTPLNNLAKALQKNLTAAECSAAVFRYLRDLSVPQQLNTQAEQDPQDQRFSHRRVWKLWVETTEELERVFSETTLSGTGWAEILIDALQGLNLKQIPATLDQVLLGSIERSRHPDVKIAFLVGACASMFPIPLAQDELLTEQDAKAAAKEELYVTQRQEQALAGRRYLTYIALTRSSDRLYLTFPMRDEKGTPCAPWPGLERLCSLFADVAIRYGDSESQDFFCPAPAILTERLCAALGADSRADEITRRKARSILSLCKSSDQPSLSALCGHVEYALGYRNEASLDKTLLGQWIRWPLTVSETRLTAYAACPYKHFARYGLNLKKRDILRLEPVDIGQFYHDILHLLFHDMKQQGLDWTAIPQDSLANRGQRAAETLIRRQPRLSAFVRRSAQNAYIIRQATERLCRFLPMMAQVSAAGTFRQALAEYEFGKDRPLSIGIRDGKCLHLRGRIDRVDCAEINGTLAGIVIDYKTGSKRMLWKEFYHGLDLQLATYLLAIPTLCVEDRPVEIAAGAFYLPIEAGTGKSWDADNNEQPDTAAIKARGVLDGNYTFHLDSSSSTRSRYYSFMLDAKDNLPYAYYGTSDAVRPADFGALLDFTRGMIGRLAEGLGSGDIRVHPYRLSRQSPCSFCDYRAVCKFDWQLNEYRPLESLNKAEVLERISKGSAQ